jgi:hypothetical protein
MFQPVLSGVSTISGTGTVVLKINDGEGAEVDLFFVENSPAAVSVLGRTPQTPIEQISTFVSKLLHDAGFDSFEFERAAGPRGTQISSVWYDHPTELNDAGCVVVVPQ